MARITKEQIMKANAKMNNGFVLDVRHYLIWNEKRCHKYIDFNNGNKLECVIQYSEHTSWENGVNRHYTIEITTSEWTPSTTTDCYVCNSGFRRYELDGTYDKKMFNKLQTITSNITDDLILNINTNGSEVFKNGIIC